MSYPLTLNEASTWQAFYTDVVTQYENSLISARVPAVQ